MEVEGQRRLHAGRLDEVGDVRLAVEVRGVSQDTRVARGFQMVPSSKQKWREKEMGVGMLSAASGRKTIHDGYPASSRRRDWPETQGRARGRGPRPPIRRSQTPGAAPGPRPAGESWGRKCWRPGGTGRALHRLKQTAVSLLPRSHVSLPSPDDGRHPELVRKRPSCSPRGPEAGNESPVSPRASGDARLRTRAGGRFHPRPSGGPAAPARF